MRRNQNKNYLKKQQKDCSMDFKTPIVLDIGSGTFKAGFANEVAPIVSFPTCLGCKKSNFLNFDTNEESLDNMIFGEEALRAARLRRIKNLRYPVSRGLVTNWEDMNTFYLMF